MIPDLLRHQLGAMVRRAVIATAARAHWKHDRTGRVLPFPHNDKAALRDRNGLPPARDLSLRAGGTFSHSFHGGQYGD